MLEKQLLHAQVRVKESQAKEQIRQMQQEQEERRFRMDLEKLRQQVKDLKNSEERLKFDHAQQVIEITDQVQSEHQKQLAENEERFMVQINEIKRAHARERETLIEQKCTATQELQIIKMDHSELIRNINFEEQRELVETIALLSAQIAHLQVMLQEQKSNFEMREGQLRAEKTSLEAMIAQLELSLGNEKKEKEAVQQELSRKVAELEEKVSAVNAEKD